MNTTNLVSTPNITGNIGSCTIQSNEVKILDRVFTSEWRTTQINSCTGQIITSVDYTSFFGVWITILVGFFALIFILGALSDNY